MGPRSLRAPTTALAIEMGADAEETLSETIGMAAEAFECTITDLYLPKKH